MKPLLSDITVNGQVIGTAEIAAEAQNHPAPKAKPGLPWKAAGRALTIRALLLQEARSLGLTPDPQEVSPGQVETEEEALVRQVLDGAVVPASPGEEEVHAVYAAAPDQYRAPTLYEAAHILIKPLPGAADPRAEALNRTKGLLAAILKDPRSFDRIAREESACSSGLSGGRLGQLTSGDTVPEFEAALDRLAEGEIAAEPVETRYGFHILRLDARAKGAVLPYEAAAVRIRAALEKAAWVRAAHDYIAELASRAEITGIELQAA